ncbi:MAG: hypothetical protein NW215_10660 [Hyphomicrobiales bacterium]|nr:hypothetical protein [Hyphomicrobiales bacterium]
MSRLFTDILRDLSGGRIVDELTEHLAEVAKAVEDTGKAGALKLTLKISPNGDGSATIEATVSATTPKPNFGKTLFFTDKDGGLHRRDPRQAEMFAAVNRASGVTDAVAGANA